eukprot:CAMPEP_0119015116 /NCGR_PEP_ID=MMETSP1176-20130426/10567_1 /TAXON_ID=265551 /ORGANISM="Synedropsis recta cf, Strain CCMP1620" /LENGTH=413 /DNA_ID=CAMNT_0006968385 /DNA_START=11 /DNA_END=1249 /DNA_ORIENTATION=-
MRSTVHRRISTREASSQSITTDEGGEQQELNLDHLVVRRKLHYQITRDEGLDSTWWGTTWKTLGSFFLTLLLLGPFLHASYQQYHQQQQQQHSPLSSETPIVPSDDVITVLDFLIKADLLSCASTNLLHLNTTYSQMYLDIKLERKSMCRDHAGTKRCRCHNPTIPNRRNVGANKGTWSNESWRAAFERNKEMAASSFLGEDQQQLDVVFLGDSITEMWQGTAMNNEIKQAKEVPAFWNELFLQDNHRALQLGIAGDLSNNLLYRLQNGELPETLNPTAWWILIGTNDYVDNCARNAILVGIMAILDEVLRHNKSAATARVVLNTLLPRGKDKNLLDSNMWQDFMWINDQLECLAQSLPEQLSFFNGTSLFLTNDGKHQVNHTLMYDYLHPSLEGYKVWGSAILEKLKDIGVW